MIQKLKAFRRGKRHVARADHQRDKIVAEAEENRHADEEDHGGAVHGEQAVEDLRRDEVIVGNGELNAHQQRLRSPATSRKISA